MDFDSQRIERFAELLGELPVPGDFRALVRVVIAENESPRSSGQPCHALVEAAMLFFLVSPPSRVRSRHERRVFTGRFTIRPFAARVAQPFMVDIARNTIEVRDVVTEASGGELRAFGRHSEHCFGGEVFGLSATPPSEKVRELAGNFHEPHLRLGVTARASLVRANRVEEVKEVVP